MSDDYTTGKDRGKRPFVVDIEEASVQNSHYRRTLWTGEHLQLTVMSIDVGDDVGLEVHPDNDQFLRVEQGTGRTEMGPAKDDLNFVREVEDDDVIMVPAGTWHNVVNTGDRPLKLYALYGPPDHEPGTVHPAHEDAEKDPNED
ncbi:cupin domain-containing protein [Nocardiopsis alkaliphila]|uniref:cupin domain-containing protein n=1 Tax=Nocardiopsis alkaliphila TaxID=225762 RepID=UPI000372A839|nr:cupin domain-containing protein [Nocardiopsis alkaliphila]